MIAGALSQLIAAVEARGVTVVFETAPQDDWRYVGIFRANAIILYSIDDPLLALFTVAHLFGHLCQRATQDAQRIAVSQYVGSGRQLVQRELEEITAYEHEAAQIGRALLAETLHVTPALDVEYARLFFADAAYLMHFLKTGERGPELFERFLAAQPRGPLIAADARLLRRSFDVVHPDIVVV